jgi:hypothetical protein
MKMNDHIRSVDDVGRRCLVVYSAFLAGIREDRSKLTAWLRSEDLWASVSPSEVEFLTTEDPSREHYINAIWRIEALQPLLWAVGKVPDMNPPTSMCDVERLIHSMPKPGAPTQSFLDSLSLRPEKEILDAGEEIWRIHWKIRDAQINGKLIPQGYDPEVVEQRHHALNWLTNCFGEEWDDIITDT